MTIAGKGRKGDGRLPGLGRRAEKRASCNPGLTSRISCLPYCGRGDLRGSAGLLGCVTGPRRQAKRQDDL